MVNGERNVEDMRQGQVCIEERVSVCVCVSVCACVWREKSN